MNTRQQIVEKRRNDTGYFYGKETVVRGEREIPSSAGGTLNDAERRTLGIAAREERSPLATGFNKLKLNKVM